MIELAEAYNATLVLIEDTGVGTGLIAELKTRDIDGVGVIPSFFRNRLLSRSDRTDEMHGISHTRKRSDTTVSQIEMSLINNIAGEGMSDT